MKYFTAELLALGRSDDDRALDEQERLWEDASDRYVAYLDTVRPRFPAGLRTIDESYYLHDAIVCSMGRRDDTFVMVLRLDTPPQSILTFAYDLVEDPVVIKNAVPYDHFGTGPLVEWQYNEPEQRLGAAVALPGHSRRGSPDRVANARASRTRHFLRPATCRLGPSFGIGKREDWRRY